MKKILNSYKMYNKVDPIGHIFYWHSILIICSAYPIHNFIYSCNENLFLFDRIFSIALAFLLFSEFNLQNKTTKYSREITEKTLEIHFIMTSEVAKKLNKLQQTTLDLHNYSISKLNGIEIDQKKALAATEKLKTLIENQEGIIKTRSQESIDKIKKLTDMNKQLSFIQNTILILISISTILWGFGSLII